MNFGTRLTLNPVPSLAPDQYTATANGATVDTSGAESALVVVTTGAFGGSGSPAATISLQESADGVTFTNVADTDLNGAAGNASGIAVTPNSLTKFDYVGTKRYIRIVIDAVTGTSPVIRMGANIILGHLRFAGGQPV